MERRFGGLACDCLNVPLGFCLPGTRLLSLDLCSSNAHQYNTYTQEYWLDRTDRMKEDRLRDQGRTSMPGVCNYGYVPLGNIIMRI